MSLKQIENIETEVDPRRLAHPTLAFLRAYWDEKRGSRPMPSRADIDPQEMKEHLGWIVLIDVLPHLVDFRFRLVGTRVTTYFLRDSTGKTFTECYAPFGLAVVNGMLAVHRKVARDCVPLRVFGSAGWLGDRVPDFDTLLLPLSDDCITANMLISAFTFDREAQRSGQCEGSF